MNNHLHIVCLDAPSPPNYGGGIDMFYKIKALAEAGKRIRLHYFNYNSSRNTNELEAYCEKIYAYPRKSFFQSALNAMPFIVYSRVNSELISRLNEDENPVLLEGLHCSGVLSHLKNANRAIVRMHNEESTYYSHLAETETRWLKKNFFLREAKLLHNYQVELEKTTRLACLSETDIAVLKNEYRFQKLYFIPCFIPWQEINIKKGIGTYCLYHGNLHVSENEEAANWLIDHVFSKIDIRLIIAGRGISKKLTAKAANRGNISLINNPGITEIDELIRNAQVNVLPSMNNTGVKLKLLNALLNGRHCITNYNGIKGSKIEFGVAVMDDPADWISTIKSFMSKEFSSTEKQQRKAVLELYDNKMNAKKLIAIW